MWQPLQTLPWLQTNHWVSKVYRAVLIKAYTGFAISYLHIRLETATSSPGPELGLGLVVHHPDMAPSGHKQLCSVIKIATNKKHNLLASKGYTSVTINLGRTPSVNQTWKMPEILPEQDFLFSNFTRMCVKYTRSIIAKICVNLVPG